MGQRAAKCDCSRQPRTTGMLRVRRSTPQSDGGPPRDRPAPAATDAAPHRDTGRLGHRGGRDLGPSFADAVGATTPFIR
jgi:hypothetical protein